MGRGERGFIIFKKGREKKKVKQKAYLKKLLRSRNKELTRWEKMWITKKMQIERDAQDMWSKVIVTGIPEERTERMRKRCDSEMMAETQQKHKGGNLQSGQTR